MDKLLERIARNTDPKSSFYIALNEKSTRIRTEFRPVIELDCNKKYEMALVSLDTYNSIPNIDETNNNFKYSPDNGTTWFNVDIPEGCYEIEDINNQIQKIMKDNKHGAAVSVTANNNTLRTVLIIDENYKVDFTCAKSIRSVLGFNEQMYSEGYNESENITNIMSVNSLIVTNDIVSGSYSNGETKNIIYWFTVNVGPGFKINETPTNLIYLPIMLSTLSSMETKLTDQHGKLANLRGEELSIRFHVREA
jgi:hypothetical protein